jgi:hypothetical protein
MQLHAWRMTPIVVFIAAWLFTGDRSVAAGGQADMTLRWPPAFNSEPQPTTWTERTLKSGGLQIAVSLPDGWQTGPSDPASLVVVDVAAGLRMEIAEPIEAKFILDAPLAADRLSGSIKTMQAALAAKGYVVDAAGQLRIRQQLWVWHESRIPTFNVSRAPEFQEILRASAIESARTWSFMATPHHRLVRVYLAALQPRGLSPAEIEARLSRAGATFAAMLRRLTFTAATP